MAKEPNQHGLAAAAELVRADPVFYPEFQKLIDDDRFEAAWQSLDVPSFTESFNGFTTSISEYNSFHLRERRLWALKMGKGSLPRGLEESFRGSIPHGRRRFTEAFSAIDGCLASVEHSEFRALANTHVAELTRRFTFDDHTVFGHAAANCFRRIGCSSAMIDDFKQQYAPIGYDFIGRIGRGDVANLRPIATHAVEAQLEILRHTEEHGFDYLYGGGPPAWAVTASEILAFFGIAISAWVIVVIVAVIAITLAILCAIFWSSLPTWAQAGCVALASAGIISFVW
jgi:hypothetical protein